MAGAAAFWGIGGFFFDTAKNHYIERDAKDLLKGMEGKTRKFLKKAAHFPFKGPPDPK